MKLTNLAAVAGVLLLVSSSGGGAGSDVEIHCAPKKLSEAAKGGSYTTMKAKEQWSYEITVENKTFKDMAGVEVKYIIFYKPEKLGERTQEKVKRHPGTLPVGALRSREKRVLRTDSVELSKAQLVNDFFYPDGGRQAAQDTLGGLWVRVFQNGRLVGEYANPSNLTKETWE